MIVKYKTIKEIIDDKHGYTEDYVKEHINEIVRLINAASKYLLTLPKGEHIGGLQIKYNSNLITQIIVDAVEGLKRLQGFHPITNANAIKEAAYVGYWWVRRKPIYIEGDISKIQLSAVTDEQIKKIKARFLFVNESCVAHYIRSKIFAQKNYIKHCKTASHDQDWINARNYLIYYLAYRMDSPKCLEAVLSSETLHPMWKTKQNFWDKIFDE